MILTVAHVGDFDQFVTTFSTVGVAKRREHRCRGSRVFRDPERPDQVWALFDWSAEDYAAFLRDPEIPEIAAALGVTDAPVTVHSVAEFEA